jgi:hypothetical protein
MHDTNCSTCNKGLTDCRNCRQKHRDSAEYDALIKRLKRIEGQVRGVQGMVEKDAQIILGACEEILERMEKELYSMQEKM